MKKYISQTPKQVLRFKLVFNQIALKRVVNHLENMHVAGVEELDFMIRTTLEQAKETLAIVERLKGE